MSAEEYTGGPGMDFATWVEDQTPAGQSRARQIAEDAAMLAEFFAYEKRCRDGAALAARAATPEAQETAARAKTIGLFDPVSPDAGPQCPSKRPTDPDRYYKGPTRPPWRSAGHTARGTSRTARPPSHRGPDGGAGGADG